MDKAKSLSAKYGIPAAMILGHKRYSYCSASEAILSSVSRDGRTAIYQGVCSCRHIYKEQFQKEQFQVEELKRRTRVKIVNGENVLSADDNKVNSAELENF